MKIRAQIGMVQQDTALLADLTDFGQWLDDTNLVIRQHDGHQQRIVPDRVGNALHVQLSGDRIAHLPNGQQGDLEAAAS